VPRNDAKRLWQTVSARQPSLRGGRHCEERSKKQTLRRTGFNELEIASHFVPRGRNDAKRTKQSLAMTQSV